MQSIIIVLTFVAGLVLGCSETSFNDKATARQTNKQPGNDALPSGGNRGAQDGGDDEVDTLNEDAEFIGDPDDEGLDQGNIEFDEDDEDEEDPFPSGEDVVIDEDAFSSTPGEVVDRFGVHFEDGSDNDFNDLSACFVGKFKISGKSVVSLGQQTIDIDLKRISGASHTYTLKTLRSDGNEIDVFTGTPPANTKVSHTSEIFAGSKIVVQTSTSKRTISMSDNNRAKIELNVCRDTGT